eukprot:Gb_15112 [translate_table: standard]
MEPAPKRTRQGVDEEESKDDVKIAMEENEQRVLALVNSSRLEVEQLNKQIETLKSQVSLILCDYLRHGLGLQGDRDAGFGCIVSRERHVQGKQCELFYDCLPICTTPMRFSGAAFELLTGSWQCYFTTHRPNLLHPCSLAVSCACIWNDSVEFELVLGSLQLLPNITASPNSGGLQLGEAQKRLSDAEAELSQIHIKPEPKAEECYEILVTDCSVPQVKTEPKSVSPGRAEQNGTGTAPQSRPQLVIPVATTKKGQSMRCADVTMKKLSTPGARTIASSCRQFESSGILSKSTVDASVAKASNESESDESQDKRPKRKSGSM